MSIGKDDKAFFYSYYPAGAVKRWKNKFVADLFNNLMAVKPQT